MLFQMVRKIFHEPSGCFFLIERYLPSSWITSPPALGVSVTEEVPRTKAQSPWQLKVQSP